MNEEPKDVKRLAGPEWFVAFFEAAAKGGSAEELFKTFDPTNQAIKSIEASLNKGENWVRVFDRLMALTSKALSEAEAQSAPTVPSEIKLVWLLHVAGWMLSRKYREEVLYKSLLALTADYIDSLDPVYQGYWTQKWMRLCFVAKACGLVLSTIRVATVAWTLAGLYGVKQWMISFWAT